MDECSGPPDFNPEFAKQIVSLCEMPPTVNPQEAGLRAAFSVYHRSLFNTDQQAWEHYRSTRQRYYEWKQCVELVRSTEDIDTLSRPKRDLGSAGGDGRVEGDLYVDGSLRVDGSLHVDGDIRVSGYVIAEEFKSQGPPGAPPPPPSPPAEPMESPGHDVTGHDNDEDDDSDNDLDRISETHSAERPTLSLSSVEKKDDSQACKPAYSARNASAGETGTNEMSNSTNRGGAAGAAIGTGAAAGALIGGATAAPIAVAGVQAVGFGAGGIVSGSTAAAIMSAEAIAGGGAVAAGGTTATLQSIGATASLGALGAGGIAVAAAGALAGAALFVGTGYLIHKHVWHSPDGQTPSQVEGVKLGKWMVLTEEGSGRVKFYCFETEELARRYFKDSWHARVLLDDIGHEKAAGTWNKAALWTIRSQYGTSPHNSTNGFRPAWLAAGNVVALHNPTSNRFIRMMGESIDARGGQMGLEDIPREWKSERFTVVDAGNGEYALHSEIHNRFVRVMGEHVDAKGGVRNKNELPPEWDSERLTIVDAGDGLVALHSKSHNRFVKMAGKDVNAAGWGGSGRRDVDSLPISWMAERFAVRLA